MRAWIPLDLRNIDKTEALRNQLRRLNDFLSDLAASLAPSSLVPQQPDSLTIFNDFIQNLNISGGDAKNLIFFDDFMYDPQADPAPGASGVWRTGSQGAGGSWLTYEGETDKSVFGVHRFTSNATVGDTQSIHMWARNVPTKPFTLVPGLEIGFRVRRDATDFTQAQFVVSFGDGFSGDASMVHSLRFVIYNDTNGADDTILIDAFDTTLGVTRIKSVISTTDQITTFKNIKLIVTGEQSVECYIEGGLVATLSGPQIPSSTEKIGIQIYQQTAGGANPGVTQKSYIDRFYIDASRIERGSN
jgi:hypothetical protein